MAMNEDALAVMVKLPVEGTVKTRLSPELSAKEACTLYEAFLRDLFSRLSTLTETDVFVYYTVQYGDKTILLGNENTPEQAVDKFVLLSNITPEGFVLTPQKDGDLGDRMQGAFEGLFSRGYKRVALIGSDIPDIPLDSIRRTFMTLKGRCGEEPRRLVLGPAIDGGYYLIAMNASLSGSSASLFSNVSWSMPSVLHETLGRAEEAEMQVAMLQEWHDIDTYADLRHIEGNPELPATQLVLQGLAGR